MKALITSILFALSITVGLHAQITVTPGIITLMPDTAQRGNISCMVNHADGKQCIYQVPDNTWAPAMDTVKWGRTEMVEVSEPEFKLDTERMFNELTKELRQKSKVDVGLFLKVLILEQRIEALEQKLYGKTKNTTPKN